MFETLQHRLGGIFDKLADQPSRCDSKRGKADRGMTGQLAAAGHEVR
jgi:hypothetical protein